MATVGKAVLILAQEGAEVEPVLTAWRRSADEPSVLVLQQAAGESLGDFKRRLHLRLAGLDDGGRGIERSAFVAKSGFGLQDVLATVALLSSLVATMVPVGMGTVYLWGHRGDAGFALEALADAMRDQVRGTGIEVITEEASQSGVHMVVGALAGRSVASRA
jgi:hypothetical protein